jgi:hypothetical protein
VTRKAQKYDNILLLAKPLRLQPANDEVWLLVRKRDAPFPDFRRQSGEWEVLSLHGVEWQLLLFNVVGFQLACSIRK